ncbi:MAG: hypothetical protein AVDCRST_MAG76-3361, partial [uncultured Acidimicrobiales bacterium]
ATDRRPQDLQDPRALPQPGELRRRARGLLRRPRP